MSHPPSRAPDRAFDPARLHALADACDRELDRIVAWWRANVLIGDSGAFVGEVGIDGRAHPDADQCIILASRLLWFMSALAARGRHEGAPLLADRLAATLIGRFIDGASGGAVWAIASSGDVVDDARLAYAQAFAIYGLATHHRASGDDRSLGAALDLFERLEDFLRDGRHGGYVEAADRQWQPVRDYRLSSDSLAAVKTMNTHLHVMEAYTALAMATPDARVREALRHAIMLMVDRIFDAEDGHLTLFFEADWTAIGSAVSFGHDIEASWLLTEAAGALGDSGVATCANAAALRLVEATLVEGLSASGRLRGERRQDGTLDADAEWWAPCEAMVGLVNAFELTQDSRYLGSAELVWRAIQQDYLEPDGEWRWFPGSSGRTGPYRAGAWKCPYHNGRAMIEISNRLRAIART